jgi:hypothetical protein
MMHHSELSHNPDIVKDVFNSTVYSTLINKCITQVIGAALGTKYFSNLWDLALGLSTKVFSTLCIIRLNCRPSGVWHIM